MSQLKYTLIVFLCFILSGCASMGSGTKEEKKKKILAMEKEVLAQLYQKKPDVKSQIKSASGYAVFSNANVNLILIAAGTGYGVVTENKTGKKTYMNMAEGGVGLGLGAKDYRIVMIFHKDSAIESFLESGWKSGANADASAKAINKGGEFSGEAYSGDVSVYTFTKTGLALQATIKGTKFWKDKNLN